ncbi:MAG: hypothetical protein K1W01_09710 [Muribaculaceae bacterium]
MNKLKDPKLIAAIIVVVAIACATGFMAYKHYTGEDYLYSKICQDFDEGKCQEVVDTYPKVEWDDKFCSLNRAEALARVAESYYHLGQYAKGREAVEEVLGMGSEAKLRVIEPWMAEHQLYGDMAEIIPTDLPAAARIFARRNKNDVYRAMAIFFDKQDWEAMNRMRYANEGYHQLALLHRPEFSEHSSDLRRDLIYNELLECELAPEFAIEYGDAALIDFSDMPLSERLDKAENAYRLALANYPYKKAEIETRLKYVDMLRNDMNTDPAKVKGDEREHPWLLENYAFHIGRRSDCNLWHYSPGNLPEDNSVGIIGSFEGCENRRNVYIGRIKMTWNGDTYRPLIADTCLMFEIEPYRGIYNVREIDGKTINWRNQQ